MENTSLFHIRSIFNFCWSILITTLIITLGLYMATELSGYHPETLQNPVNRNNCTCCCWDGFYRGLHSRGGYKTFYINYEKQTILLVGIFLFYSEILRNFLVKICLTLNFSLLLLFPSIYSNFYGIWNIINYLNDHDYYRMLPSQIYFSSTEIISNFIFYKCLLIDNTSSISQWCLDLISIFSSVHIFVAMKELNMKLMRRNIPLLIPDIINLIWIGIIFVKNRELCLIKSSIWTWLSGVIVMLTFYYVVCPYRD